MLQLKKQTRENLLRQGLLSWDNALYLISERMLSQIPEGTTLESIMGDIVDFAMKPDGVPNIDTDTRGGWLAYGVRAVDGVDNC